MCLTNNSTILFAACLASGDTEGNAIAAVAEAVIVEGPAPGVVVIAGEEKADWVDDAPNMGWEGDVCIDGDIAPNTGCEVDACIDGDDKPNIGCEEEPAILVVDSGMNEASDIGMAIEISVTSAPAVIIVSIVPTEVIGNIDELERAGEVTLDAL